MTERHFIVSQRDNIWIYSSIGDEAGPFKTRKEAVEAAIEDAVQTNDQSAKVIVLDRDLQQETVWTHPDGN